MPTPTPFLPPTFEDLDPTKAYGVAVSGGADSVALLLLLHAAGFRLLHVLHLNHGLRGLESDGDAAFTQALAAELALPCTVLHLDVAAEAQERGLSLEETGRQLRHHFFAEKQVTGSLHGILLAHHADDLAETVLLHLFRGTAGKGLAGLAPKTTLSVTTTCTQAPVELILLRPLLGIRRDALRSWLEARGQTWREDHTNAEPVAARNRLRNELLPLANAIFDRDVTPAILRLAEQQRADQTFLSDTLAAVPLTPRLPVATLRKFSPSLAQRLLVKWLTEEHRITSISSQLVHAAMRLVHESSPASVNLPANRRLRRTAGELWVTD